MSGINYRLLCAWESNTALMQTTDANECAKAFQRLGVQCSARWLLTGEGVPPFLTEADKGRAKQPLAVPGVGQGSLKSSQGRSDRQRLNDDIQLFVTQNLNPIVHSVSDAAMAPAYLIGDYVAGSWHSPQSLRLKSHGAVCLVKLANREIILRLVRPTQLKPGLFDLFAHSKSYAGPYAEERGVEVLQIAPVKWHRRRYL